jgi:response regulator RpfG family c-di-GMP phosphodiesterase
MSTIRVLLVDDTERDLRSLERTLRIVDAEVDIVGTAATGEEALGVAANVPFDVAVVDYKMPGMNGVEVAAGLKEIRPDCKVVVITAYDDARGEIESSPHVDHYHPRRCTPSWVVNPSAPPPAPRRSAGSSAAADQLRVCGPDAGDHRHGDRTFDRASC